MNNEALKERLDRGTMYEPNTGCWLWIEGTNVHGYGQLRWEDYPYLYHRLRYSLEFGEIPNDLCVLHRCDVRRCGNPQHLFLGTRTDNAKDKISKGRQLRGEFLPQSKLDPTQVRVIKSLKGTFSQNQIAKYFRVNRGTIKDIHINRNWKHI